MNKYYVYTHSNDVGIFYIGKGTRRRAWDKNRGPRWLETVKGGYTVDVPYTDLTEEEALDLEAILIQLHGIENLVNVIKPTPKESRGTMYYDILQKAKDIKVLCDIHENFSYYYKIPFFKEQIQLIHFVDTLREEIKLL